MMTSIQSILAVTTIVALGYFYGVEAAIVHNKMPLASGWDSQAQQLYDNEIKRMHATVAKNPKVLHEYKTLDREPTKYFDEDNWFAVINGNPKWEPRTFQIFSKVLNHSTYHIDFGTWRGPTLLFATQFVQMALGIEADPVAYAQAHYNLHLNQDKKWRRHTHMLSAAVGALDFNSKDPVNLDMQSSYAGSSCSGLGEVYNCGGKKPEEYQKWKVNAYSLHTIMQHYDIPESKQTFIKIDVESYECKLVPTWLSWFKAMGKGQKPSLYLAFHAQIAACTEEEYQQIGEIAKMYNYVECENAECIKDGKWSARANTEALLTDLDKSYFV